MSNSNKTYFSLLPSDLFGPLFLYLSADELYILLPQLKQLSDFRKLFSSLTFWRKLWYRDISSFIKAPSSITSVYEKYMDGYKRFYNPLKNDENKIFFTIDGYDRLLYPLLGPNDYDSTMSIAAGKGELPIVKEMIRLGAKNYNRALLSAANGNHIDIVALMIELGATKVNTALIIAADKGYIDVVKLLLDAGADSYEAAIREAGHIKRADIQNLIRSYQTT